MKPHAFTWVKAGGGYSSVEVGTILRDADSMNVMDATMEPETRLA
jgi:hypothetical protein